MITLTDIANCKHLSERQRALALQPGAKLVVRAVGKYGAKVAHLETKDHSIPITKAMLKGQKKTDMSARQKLMAVCRDIVAPQIKEYRANFWKLQADTRSVALCPLSKVNLLRCGQTDVDHVYPFVSLVENWLEALCLCEDDFEIRGSRQLGRATLGNALDRSWYNYHAKHAKLQLTAHRANLQKGTKIIPDVLQ
jgi:hypothetical protein